MCLSLYDYQSKTSRYKKGLTYLKKYGTTNQKQTIHLQKKKEDKSIKGNHTTTKRKRNKEKRSQLENKVSNGSKYMFINNYLKC